MIINSEKHNYIVYMHTNILNDKKYVGVTSVEKSESWNDEVRYQNNYKFYKDVKRYGWNNFKHEIIRDQLSYIEAKKIENELIQKYDLVNSGYNTLNSNLLQEIDFDFYDFKILHNKEAKYESTGSYFTRIPNQFIQKNLTKEFGLNRIFLIVFILIDRNRSFEDKSYITTKQVLNICGYKCTKRKPKIYYEILKSLLFLDTNNYIEMDEFNLNNIGYNDCLQMKIIKDNFDTISNFTKITSAQFDNIMMADSLNKENILMTFLYINSYIGCRNKILPDGNNGNPSNNPSKYEKEHPEAFWKSIESMAKEMSMSKDTIIHCINYLTTPQGDEAPLLIKKEVGSIKQDPNKPPQNVPNIYVLNRKGYKQEIEWALSKMMKVYGVTEFEKLKGKKNNRLNSTDLKKKK